jgi:hypothetical protein
MYTLLDVLEKLSISSCIYRTHFGCLLLNGCRCNKIDYYGRREDFSKDH